MWQSLYQAVDTLSRIMAHLAGLSILIIALMQVTEIIVRNLLGISLTFVWEYAAYMHIAAIFMGLSFTLRTGGHIQVTLLATALPRLFEYMSTIIGLIISSYLSYALIRMCYSWGSTGRTSGTIDNLPLVYPMAFVAFGASVLTLQLLLRLIHIILKTRRQLSWSAGPTVD
ncbi:TRAP transporter small permease [Halomonas sp. AOP42-B2-16]|uniref:TRAP transporter small permease n=1 Tax=Halomonas sp. AOP42-B2-16 TaxID=3457673 RepID=UPI004034216F